MQHLLLAGGAGVVVVLLVAVALWRRGSAESSASKRAHDAAQERDPPVDIGDTYEFGITEFTDHRSADVTYEGRA